MLDLNDLRLFVHIVDNQGILKAGRALSLPKSTISRRLAALEDQLKSRLMVRSGEGFRLTPAGERAYRAGRIVTDAASTAEADLLAERDEISGRVSVSVSTLLEPIIAPWLAEMTSRHPRLSIALDMATRDLDQAGDGFDLHLLAHDWELRDSALIQRRICRNPMMLVAHQGKGIDPSVQGGAEVLSGTPLLAYGLSLGPRRFDLVDAGERRQIALDPRVVTADTRSLVALVRAGAGIALLPEYAVRSALSSGELVEAIPGWAGPSVTISLLSPPRRLMNPTLRHVADTLGAAAKSAILERQPLPKAGQGVPIGRTSDFIQLSSAALSQSGRAAEPSRPAPHTPKRESETEMNTFTKAIGAAALTAAIAAPAAAQDASGPLVLYTNDFEGVITDRFEADTGREIDVVQMSGGEILARIAAEASNPQWDVLIFNGSYSFHGLDQQGQLLQGVEPANLDNLNELGRTYLAESRSWFPIGLAASCVMLYRTDLIETPPQSFADLADPAFNGMFGMADPAVAAPAYPCVAEFFNSLGQEEAEAYFTSLFDNGLRVFRTNGPVGQALSSGDIALALITSQVAFSLKAAGEVPVEVVWPEDGAPGVVRGVGIQAQTARPEAAKAFVEWLLEPATQTYLGEAAPADGLFEPTVTGAVRRADGPAEGSVYRVAPDDFAVANEAAIKTWFADRALD
ncbi:extracellular solute-binding protein [Arsenicitalea aurantiaca]|nr:extracellular solute-binding protein [Arsenicitalea aurantiaca]